MGNCSSSSSSRKRPNVDNQKQFNHQHAEVNINCISDSKINGEESLVTEQVHRIVTQQNYHLNNSQPPVEPQQMPVQSLGSKHIDSTKAQVQDLLKQINLFQGTSENDKNYRYLDEMLTRCILKLDTIECNSVEDRADRKEAINQVNQALSILERRMGVNSEIMELEQNLSKG